MPARKTVDEENGKIKYLAPSLLSDFNMAMIELVKSYTSGLRKLAGDCESSDPAVRLEAMKFAKGEIMPWGKLAAKEAGMKHNPLVVNPELVIETMNRDQLLELERKLENRPPEEVHPGAVVEAAEAEEPPPSAEP